MDRKSIFLWYAGVGLALCTIAGCTVDKELYVKDLRVQSLVNPECAIDTDTLSFSWVLESDTREVVQETYSITVSEDGKVIYESGIVASANSVNVTIEGLGLKPSTRYCWKVTVTDNKGRMAESREKAYFDTGLMDSGWSGAQWISVPSFDSEINAGAADEYAGVPMFRKKFSLSKKVRSAKLYTTALGIYDLKLNGKRVGHENHAEQYVYEELKPGWTDYRSRVYYSVHDVTSLLEADNVLGATVASGWWEERISQRIYGKARFAFIAKMIIEYADGTSDTLISDDSWMCSRAGALRMAEIYDGEVYDSRLERNWTSFSDDDFNWKPVVLSEYGGKVEAFCGQPVHMLGDMKQQVRKITVYEGVRNTGSDYGELNVVKEIGESSPISLKKGQSAIFDFGQNVAGWVEFKVKGRSGVSLRLQFSEMLNDTGDKDRANDGPGGSLYLRNLRSAKAEQIYILSGKAEGETYHPFATFFGFRYCQIVPTDDVEILSIESIPISSSVERLGMMQTSHKDVNRLIENIQWGQIGNTISVPTDCPQRDERLGWSGDTQVFSRTALYNANLGEFYRKWMRDMRDGQRENGMFPDIAPTCWPFFGNGAWADAAIIVPWNVWLMTGDKSIIRENYDAMTRYMSWLHSNVENGYYQGAGIEYGDWLSFVPTDKRYISVAYYANDAMLMSKMSNLLSETAGDLYSEKADDYGKLYKEIKSQFQKRYFKDGYPLNTSQTACILALKFGLYESENQKKVLTGLLEQSITDNGEKFNTGFVGTAMISTVLAEFGLMDKAYNILLQRQCPSWLYSVDQGATTIWERWNSYTIDSGFGDAGMNSFNHYAYGAVGEWMYRYMAGIDVDEHNPAFRHILLRPGPDFRQEIPAGQERIMSTSASYKSRYGTISSQWRNIDDRKFEYSCTVPANTTATLYLPVMFGNARVTENGTDVSRGGEGIKSVSMQGGQAILELGSGSYSFTIKSK